MTNSTTVFVTGKVYWPKIVGDRALHSNYDGDAREWSYEFEPDNTDFLKDAKLLGRLKEKDDEDRGPYLILRKPELDRDGNKNDPIRIYDSDNTDWGEERLIGNGTKVVAKLRIVEWGKGKKSSIYTQALRIEDYVPYVSNEFSSFDGPDEKSETVKAKKSSKAKAASFDEDLDDDIPF